MDSFQATHRELLLKILRIVDDNIQCEFVCKYWKCLLDESLVEEAERNTALFTIYTVKPASRGQLALLQWAISLGYDVGQEYSTWDNNALLAAAKFGHFDIVDWLQSEVFGCRKPTALENNVEVSVFGYYAKWSNLEAISKHIRGYKGHETYYGSSISIINYKAARHNRIDVIELVDNLYGGCSMATEDRCLGAVKSRNSHLLKLLVGGQHRPSTIYNIFNNSCCSHEDWQVWHQYAIENGDVGVLNLLRINFWSRS